VLGDRHLARTEEAMRALCDEDVEVELVEVNGENNHVHLLVNLPPKLALSRLVNNLKGVSSRRLRQEFPALRQHYWRAQPLCSGSYFAGSVDAAPLSILRQYIEQQEHPAQETLARCADSRGRFHHRPEGRRTCADPGSARRPAAGICPVRPRPVRPRPVQRRIGRHPHHFPPPTCLTHAN
jgi:REP-associated tyrosine transposase